MFIQYKATRKLLENLMHNLLLKATPFVIPKMLNSLKFLGFYSLATTGVSLGLEDIDGSLALNTNVKDMQNFIENIYSFEFLSEVDKLEYYTTFWTRISNCIYHQVEHAFKASLTNWLYMITFSGARGTSDQISQITNSRGLISTQLGCIITIPIVSNFKSGLSLFDYILTAYGARKGALDTGLQTANAGILMKILMHILQNIIIRFIDCKTQYGLQLILTSSTFLGSLKGRYLFSIISFKSNKYFTYKEPKLINSNILYILQKFKPITLQLRSILTCKTSYSFCQYCYGIDLRYKENITLGTALGIITAHTIGETGTQMTMKTFHAGGVSLTSSLEDFSAPTTGIILVPLIKTLIFGSSIYNKFVPLTHTESICYFYTWEKKIQSCFLKKKTWLHFIKNTIVLKSEIIAEIHKNIYIGNILDYVPIIPNLIGEIFIKISFFQIYNTKFRIISNSRFDIKKRHIFSFPKESKIIKHNAFSYNKNILLLKLIVPFLGTVILNKSFIFICTLNSDIYKIKLLNLNSNIFKLNIFINIFNIYKVNKYHIIGYIYMYKYIITDKIYLQYLKNVLLISIKTNNNFKVYDYISNYKYYNFFYRKSILVTSIVKQELKNTLILNTSTYFNKFINYILYKDQILGFEPFSGYNASDVTQNINSFFQCVNFKKGLKLKSLYKNTCFLLVNYKILKLKRIKNINFYSIYYVKKNKYSTLINSYLIFTKYFNTKDQIHFENYKIKIKFLQFRVFLKFYFKINKHKFISFFINLLQKNKLNKILFNIIKNKLKYFLYNCLVFIKKNNKCIIKFYNIFIILKILKKESILFTFIPLSKIYTFGTIYNNLNLYDLFTSIYTRNCCLFNNLISIKLILAQMKLFILRHFCELYNELSVKISSKHFEVILHKLNSFVYIHKIGDTPLKQNEKLELNIIEPILKLCFIHKYKLPKLKPIFHILNKKGKKRKTLMKFKTKLIKSAIKGRINFFSTLRESAILGTLSNSGTTYLNYTNYLNNLYLFKL